MNGQLNHYGSEHRYLVSDELKAEVLFRMAQGSRCATRGWGIETHMIVLAIVGMTIGGLGFLATNSHPGAGPA